MSVQKEMEELMNDLQHKERVTQKMIEANLNNVLLEVDKKDKQILFQQEATRAREQVAQYEAILEKQKEMNAYGRIDEQQAKEIDDLQEELRGKDSEIDRLKMIINTQKKTEEKQKQERKQMRMSQKGAKSWRCGEKSEHTSEKAERGERERRMWRRLDGSSWCLRIRERCVCGASLGA